LILGFVGVADGARFNLIVAGANHVEMGQGSFVALYGGKGGIRRRFCDGDASERGKAGKSAKHIRRFKTLVVGQPSFGCGRRRGGG
jgi:hypothetical protein